MVKRLKFFTIISLVFLSIFVLASCGGNSADQGSTTPTSGDSGTVPTTPGGNTNTGDTNKDTNSNTGTHTDDHQHTYGDWTSNAENHWHECSCGAKKDLSAHSLNIVQTDATCDANGTITYTCDVCGYTNTVTVQKLEHQISSIDYKDEDVANEPCKHEHITFGICGLCQQEIVLDRAPYEIHTYKASIEEAATCSKAGKYLYECELCDDKYEVEYTNKDAHTWGEPVTNGNKKIYTCSGCNATKEVIDATQEVAADVSATDLVEVGAVELKNATIALDNNALETLNGATNINISADTVDKTTLEVKDTVKERIGDNEVFDFQMTADGNQVSQFDGYITVTIPYTLKDTDDPNAIVIWYLGESDEPEAISAKYSNGFVSFETNHFSYYVVVQMTPEEACAIFEHEYVEISKTESTCETVGVKIEKCTRCHDIHTTELELKKHNWVEVRTQAPTISAPGLSVSECSNCHQTKVIQLPKLSNKDASIIAKLFDGVIAQIKAEGIKVEQTGDDNSFVAQIKLNGSLFYEITINENGNYSISLLDLSNGNITNYGVSSDYYSYSGSEMPMAGLISMDLMFNNKVFKLTDLLTQYVDSKLLDDFITRILALAFELKVDNSGNIVYTFDADKVTALYEEALDLKISQIVDLLLGENAFNNIVKSITAAKNNKTLGDVIEDFAKQGIDVEGIINFALAYLDYYQSNYDLELPFNTKMITTMLTQYKTMKVEDLLAMLPMNMTIDNLLQMVNQFKDAKIADLMGMFGGQSQAQASDGSTSQTSTSSGPQSQASDGSTSQTSTSSGPQLPTKEVIAAMLQDITMSITLNKDYGVQSVNFATKEMTVAITKGENVIDTYEKAEKEIKALVDPMKIDGDSKLFDKAFNQTFGTNLTFEYVVKNGNIIATANVDSETLNKFTKYMEINSSAIMSLKSNPTGYFFEFNFGEQRYVHAEVYDSLNYICRSLNGNERVSVYAIVDDNPVYIGNIRLYDLGNYIIVNRTNNKYYLTRHIDMYQYVFELVSKDDIPANAHISENTVEYNHYLSKIDGIEEETIYLKGTNIFGEEDIYRSYVVYKKDGKYIRAHLFGEDLDLYPVELESFSNIWINYYFDGSLYYTLDSNDWTNNKGEDGTYTYISKATTNGKASFTYKETTNKIVKYELKVLDKTFNLSFDYNKSYTYSASATPVVTYTIGQCSVFKIYVAFENENVLIATTNSNHNHATRTIFPATLTQNEVVEDYCTRCGETWGSYTNADPKGQITENNEVVFEDFSNDDYPYLYGWYLGDRDDTYSLWNNFTVLYTVVEEVTDADGNTSLTIVDTAPAAKAHESKYRRYILHDGENGNKWMQEDWNGRFLEFDKNEIEDKFAEYKLADNQKIAIAAINNYSHNATVYVIE
jgi:hypothetical protein